jgi:hypothetical protein
VLNREQVQEFVERGYVLVPQVVPEDRLAEASRAIDTLIAGDPPPPEHRGPHFYFPDADDVPALRDLLIPAWPYAETLIGEGRLPKPTQVQVALTIPPFPHRPGMHHLDGCPPGPDGPYTFTMLAGVLLSDQLDEDAGNLWVWPGTHHTHAEYFREHGPDALVAAGGYPPIRLPEPVQLVGRAGDLLLAHYLLGHNIGGNTAERTRRTAYFRLKAQGHDWRAALRDPWLDYRIPGSSQG